MRFASVMFIKWNDAIFYQNVVKSGSCILAHVVYWSENNPCVYALRSILPLCPLADIYKFNKSNLAQVCGGSIMFVINFHKLHSICFQMRLKARYFCRISRVRLKIAESKFAGCRQGNLSFETTTQKGARGTCMCIVMTYRNMGLLPDT